ncbi:MAG: haloacid dehalogenase-like hydrolase, partial [Hyphomonadaceae bacterium]
GFADFVAWCEARAIPVTVVSDGVDYFIQRVLRRHGLARLPVYSNQLVRHDDGALSLRQPWRSPACSAGSGVCKCAVARAIKEPMVFVGDGRSDQCVSHRAEQLFAKDKLAEYCRKNGLPFLSYATFDDVRAALADVRAARELGAGDAGENLTITE